MVGLRPDGSPGPEPCSNSALYNMKTLRLHPGDHTRIDVDLNKQGQDNITVNDGPIESRLRGNLGPILGFGTLLYGKVWTRGPQVVIRYYQAQPQDLGPPIDICAVAYLGSERTPKISGPAPGSAVLESGFASVVVVDDFR